MGENQPIRFERVPLGEPFDLGEHEIWHEVDVNYDRGYITIAVRETASDKCKEVA